MRVEPSETPNRALQCYSEGQYYKALPYYPEACMPCGGMDCVDCSKGYSTDVLPGYSMSTSVLKTVRTKGFNSVADQRAIYPCPLCDLTDGERYQTGGMGDCPCEGLPIYGLSDFPTADPTSGSECKAGLSV